MRARRHVYALVPLAVGALVCGVVIVGVALTLLPAFVAPTAAGSDAPGLDAWRALMALPGIGADVAFTLATAAGATLASFFVACSIGAWAITPRRRNWALVLAASIAAIPAAALAAGVAELTTSAAVLSAAMGWGASPSGEPVGTGMLVVALCLKVAPFLAAMMLIAVSRPGVDRHAAAARTLGYAHAEAFAKLILPQVYRFMRLPVCAALAWSLSAIGAEAFAVPMRRIPLAEIAWRGLSAGSVAERSEGAAAAGLVLAFTVAAIVAYFVLERIVRRAGRAWQRSGRRGTSSSVLAGLGLTTSAVGLAAVVASLGTLVAAASSAGGLVGPAATAAASPLATGVVTTLAIAVVATLVAVVVAVGCLEAEDRSRRRSAWPMLLWAPWVVPQIAFLPGIAWVLSDAGLRAPLVVAIASQLVFVIPCVALAVVVPWRALDPRYVQCAEALRAAPRRVLARIKLPLVAQPVAIACALAFAVSAGLFLPVRLTVPERIATLESDVVSSARAPVSNEAALAATLLALVPAGLVAIAVAFGVAPQGRAQPAMASAAWQSAAG